MAHPLSPLPYGASPLPSSRSSSPVMATEVERWLAHTPNCHLDCEDHSFKMPSARRLQATKNRAHTAVATSTLQKQLESSLKHIRSRKSHLMLESISELQKKEEGWKEEISRGEKPRVTHQVGRKRYQGERSPQSLTLLPATRLILLHLVLVLDLLSGLAEGLGAGIESLITLIGS